MKGDSTKRSQMHSTSSLGDYDDDDDDNNDDGDNNDDDNNNDAKDDDEQEQRAKISSLDRAVTP